MVGGITNLTLPKIPLLFKPLNKSWQASYVSREPFRKLHDNSIEVSSRD
jgi:hypothetical protein